MENMDNHMDFENDAFVGEAGHPTKIIVKNNELGARGIGARILETLNAHVQNIEYASDRELKKTTS